MIQQINLYQAELTSRTHFKHFYAAGFAASALILLATSIYLQRSLNIDREQLNTLSQQLQTEEARLQLLQTQYSDQQPDTSLDQALQQSQTEQQGLTLLLQRLTDTQSDQAQGFSRYLSALAAQTRGDVWLTQLSINTDPDKLTLQGSSYKPEAVPGLLHRLQNSPAFAGRRFAKMDVRQSPLDRQQIDFVVSSDPETPHAPNP